MINQNDGVIIYINEDTNIAKINRLSILHSKIKIKLNAIDSSTVYRSHELTESECIYNLNIFLEYYRY